MLVFPPLSIAFHLHTNGKIIPINLFSFNPLSPIFRIFVPYFPFILAYREVSWIGAIHLFVYIQHIVSDEKMDDNMEHASAILRVWAISF